MHIRETLSPQEFEHALLMRRAIDAPISVR